LTSGDEAVAPVTLEADIKEGKVTIGIGRQGVV
jgi:hypothetical protein